MTAGSVIASGRTMIMLGLIDGVTYNRATMSVQLIQRYHTDLAQIKRIGRTKNESPLSRATERMLEDFAHQNNLFFMRHLSRNAPTGHSIIPDGIICDSFFDWGYWEAKDALVTPESWHRIQYAADALVNTLDSIDIATVTYRDTLQIIKPICDAIQMANVVA